MILFIKEMAGVLFRGKYFYNGGKDPICRKDIQDYVSSQWENYNPLISSVTNSVKDQIEGE